MSKTTEVGFSLIELLIVVAILGVIMAIAVPNLLASKRAANEASAISSMRTIHSCQLTYQATTGVGDYGDLPELAIETLTDVVLGSGSKSGYNFVVTPTAPGTVPALFYATAVPINPAGVDRTGTRRFGVTEDGVIHGDSVALTPYADGSGVRAAPALGN
jgi:prepilin-type N-terminal cleavage/methylation domain-containing protein